MRLGLKPIPALAVCLKISSFEFTNIHNPHFLYYLSHLETVKYHKYIHIEHVKLLLKA